MHCDKRAVVAVIDPCRSTLSMFVHLNHLSPEELGLAMRSNGPLSTSFFFVYKIWHRVFEIVKQLSFFLTLHNALSVHATI